jgi:cytoskeleton protein RodZ
MAADRLPHFGATLRAARERRGVSLREIANATKISMSVLEALERNDVSRLPGGIFGRAFVRSYAAAVGLDPEATIQDFMAQFPHDSVTAGHPTTAQVEDNEALESNRRMARTFLKLLAVSVPLAVLVLYFGAPQRRVNGSSERPVTLTATAATAREAPQTMAAPVNDAAHLVIGLSAVSPVWIRAAIDGQPGMRQLLRAGEERTIEVGRELVLTADDAASVRLTLNGEEGKPLGKPGEVVTARLTPANFRDYLPTNVPR